MTARRGNLSFDMRPTARLPQSSAGHPARGSDRSTPAQLRAERIPDICNAEPLTDKEIAGMVEGELQWISDPAEPEPTAWFSPRLDETIRHDLMECDFLVYDALTQFCLYDTATGLAQIRAMAEDQVQAALLPERTGRLRTLARTLPAVQDWPAQQRTDLAEGAMILAHRDGSALGGAARTMEAFVDAYRHRGEPLDLDQVQRLAVYTHPVNAMRFEKIVDKVEIHCRDPKSVPLAKWRTTFRSLAGPERLAWVLTVGNESRWTDPLTVLP